MARHISGRLNSKPEEQEEMTVVILRFRGGGDTLRKGFETVSHALSALNPSVQQLAVDRHHQEVHEASSAGTIDENELADGEGQDESDEAQSGGTSRPRRKPQFLKEFNLSPENQISLKDFASKKNPKTLHEKHLVAATWVSSHGGQPIFTVPHVFTCFRAMQWEEQTDFSQPMRQLSRTKSFFASLGDKKWELTSLGKEAVEKLPNRVGSE